MAIVECSRWRRRGERLRHGALRCATSLQEVFALHPQLASRAAGWKAVTQPVSTAPLIYRQPQTTRGNMMFGRRRGGVHRSFRWRWHINRAAQGRAAGHRRQVCGRRAGVRGVGWPPTAPSMRGSLSRCWRRRRGVRSLMSLPDSPSRRLSSCCGFRRDSLFMRKTRRAG